MSFLFLKKRWFYLNFGFFRLMIDILPDCVFQFGFSCPSKFFIEDLQCLLIERSISSIQWILQALQNVENHARYYHSVLSLSVVADYLFEYQKSIFSIKQENERFPNRSIYFSFSSQLMIGILLLVWLSIGCLCVINCLLINGW